MGISESSIRYVGKTDPRSAIITRHVGKSRDRSVTKSSRVSYKVGKNIKSRFLHFVAAGKWISLQWNSHRFLNRSNSRLIQVANLYL